MVSSENKAENTFGLVSGSLERYAKGFRSQNFRAGRGHRGYWVQLRR